MVDFPACGRYRCVAGGLVGARGGGFFPPGYSYLPAPPTVHEQGDDQAERTEEQAQDQAPEWRVAFAVEDESGEDGSQEPDRQDADQLQR